MKDYLDIADQLARVPEHSLPLMLAMSGGSPFSIGPYLFFADQDWLMAIGYPLEGDYDDESFGKALDEAKKRVGAKHCFAIGPRLPEYLRKHIVESDRFHVLGVNCPVPQRLRNQAARAALQLEVVEGGEFTGEHRRLWAEFMPGKSMTARVAELYAATPRALAHAGSQLRLLDARDEKGNLAASLLLDYAPANFVSYIIGAHSRKNYAPHATDLLFWEMINRARAAGKRYIHLGLGVNEGILRFKQKWGAKPGLPYVMAQWEEKDGNDADNRNAAHAIALALLRSGNLSARQALDIQSSERPFAMLWRLEKNNRVSWIGGTAHFFRHSFDASFRKLFSRVDKVIFEGPLDADFMARVDMAGKSLPEDSPNLAQYMSREEIEKLERVVCGPRGKLAHMLGLQNRRQVDVPWLLRNARPWHAFFSLWTAYLERMGWRESVDMEAWRIANEMNKKVIGMENLEEQLESLDSLPLERVLRFFRDCGSWKRRAANNLHAYLAGDLEKMMGSSAEFPTRTEHVVGRRDQRFRMRMRPYLEEGGAAVFVGSAHMVNLRHMLAEDGFRVVQQPFGVWPKIHLAWRRHTRPDEAIKW